MKTDGRTLEVEVSVRHPANRKRLPQPAENEPPRIPRITRLMALAIKFQDMVDRAEVRDYADLARLGYVTRARLTQIMNLLLLAPEIQEDILGVVPQTTTMTERRARALVKLVMWEEQRRAWAPRQDWQRISES
jgi:hypothetical protein